MRGLDGVGGVLARARLRQRRGLRRPLVGPLESMGGRNSSRLLQWHSTNLAALLATFGTSNAFPPCATGHVHPATVGKANRFGIGARSAGGTLQIEQCYCPNSSGKPSDIEIASHSHAVLYIIPVRRNFFSLFGGPTPSPTANFYQVSLFGPQEAGLYPAMNADLRGEPFCCNPRIAVLASMHVTFRCRGAGDHRAIGRSSQRYAMIDPAAVYHALYLATLSGPMHARLPIA